MFLFLLRSSAAVARASNRYSACSLCSGPAVLRSGDSLIRTSRDTPPSPRPRSGCCQWARWGVSPSPRTLPCHFNFPACWRCTVKVNFTLDFLLYQQSQTCPSHLHPPPLLSLRHLHRRAVWGRLPALRGALAAGSQPQVSGSGKQGRGQGEPRAALTGTPRRGRGPLHSTCRDGSPGNPPAS